MNPANITCQTGKLTSEPFFLKNKEGTEFAFISTLAVKRNYKNREGKYDLDYIPIRYEGINKMKFAHMLKKDDYLTVSGTIKSDRYKKDGVDIYTIYLLVESIQYTPRNKENIEKPESEVLDESLPL